MDETTPWTKSHAPVEINVYNDLLIQVRILLSDTARRDSFNNTLLRQQFVEKEKKQSNYVIFHELTHICYLLGHKYRLQVN